MVPKPDVQQSPNRMSGYCSGNHCAECNGFATLNPCIQNSGTLLLWQIQKLMKTSRILSFVLMLTIQASAVTVFAQNKLKAGDMITGVIRDDDGPMTMVNVTERDEDDRIVAHDITDTEGAFSFKLVNPKDRLMITYVGYETVYIPFDKKHFDITMKKHTWNTELVPAYNAMFEFIACKGAYGHGHFGCIPEDYICGYFFRPNPSRTSSCIFLTKDSEGYMLVLNSSSSRSDTLRIDSEKALRMAQSVKETIDNAVTEQHHDIEILGDPHKLYAIMPGKMAERWADEIPDQEWNELFQRLDRKQ